MAQILLLKVFFEVFTVFIFLDFDELVSFIKDHGILYKNLCPKFQRVLASRACRSAVMIGSPLTTAQIRKVKDSLIELSDSRF